MGSVSADRRIGSFALPVELPNAAGQAKPQLPLIPDRCSRSDSRRAEPGDDFASAAKQHEIAAWIVSPPDSRAYRRTEIAAHIASQQTYDFVSFFNNTTTGPAEKPNAHASPRVEVTPCEAAYVTATKPTIKPTIVMADFGDDLLR